MSISLDTNDIVRMFQVRATAELKRELDEVKWWEDRVRRGLVRREHVEAYIQASKRIIRTKRHVLGFPEFPCWSSSSVGVTDQVQPSFTNCRSFSGRSLAVSTPSKLLLNPSPNSSNLAATSNQRVTLARGS